MLTPQMKDDANVESSCSATYVLTILLDALFTLFDLYHPLFYRRGKHDRGRRYTIRRKPVDHFLQMFDRRDGDLHNERIAARPAMTFKHLVRVLAQPR